ncbi:SLBB domain-containing protein [Methylophilus sp.]|uniref:SLBB domain-containing protein n=1 Tax=Methylophilus sp. TaxID=29541 RepID=UPI000D4AA152|nr:SLBB domain-containing protein [Methylophilus sp.]PPD12393.1 MAG: polysaccharide export protein [Methylophilus sp.]
MNKLMRPIVLLIMFFPLCVFADYTLGTGDFVKVTVYGDSELTREIRIAENGVLTFPLIGEVKVGGLSTVEAEKKIAEQLQRGGYIANPQVSVVVLQFLSKTVSVLGGVLKPGRYPVTRPSDVKDMIAEAGGITPDGSEIVTVVRGDKRSEFDLHDVINQHADKDDITVIGGETIYVGSRDVAVVGQLLRPAKYGIQGGMRKISDFVSVAGGPNENAGEVMFYTTSISGTPVTEQINIDELFKAPNSAQNKQVYPGDVIYVPKAPQVYVYGEVQRPGMYKIDKNMTVMQAIAKAGGLTMRGTQRSVKLHRKDERNEVIKQTPNLTSVLQDEDVLYIEESLL